MESPRNPRSERVGRIVSEPKFTKRGGLARPRIYTDATVRRECTAAPGEFDAGAGAVVEHVNVFAACSTIHVFLLSGVASCLLLVFSSRSLAGSLTRSV